MPDPPNAAIASLFDELADLYELDGAVVHRVLAYRNAAKAVRESPVSIAALTREGRVTELAGIGKTLEEEIQALLDTALKIGDGIVHALRAVPASHRDELAGWGRRLADSVKDLDIIATADDPKALLAAFAKLDVIESCSSPGENAARARTHTGMPV